MKYFFFSFCIALLSSCSKENVFTTPNNIQLRGQIETVKTFGGSRSEIANSVIKSKDGGYLFVGNTQSIDRDIVNKTTNDSDVLITKFAESDEVEWSKVFGGSEDDSANDIISTSDGGFAVLGFSESSNGDVLQNQGATDFWLLKIDALGNLIWEKSFGFSGSDYGTTLIETKDGGFLLTGVLDVSASGGLGNKAAKARHAGGDIWAIKLDHTGNVIWRNYFGGNNTDTPFGVLETNTNDFIIAGSSDSNDTDISSNIGSYDFWLLKVSASGSLIWEKSFGGTGEDDARAIASSNDGNFVIVGDTRSSDVDVTSNKGVVDIWMLNIDTDGNLLNQKTFGGSGFDVARSISKTQHNSYIIAGSSRSLDGDVAKNKGQNDAWVLEVDANGNLLWETTIGGDNIDFFYDAVQLNNGTVVAVGNTNSNNGDILENKGFSDVLIVKIK